MKYAILCYHSENVVCAWSREHEEEVMGKLGAVLEKNAKAGRLGPVAKLMPTTAATTLRKETEPAVVLDGPFAETKEQLLGFFVAECASLEEVLDYIVRGWSYERTAQRLGFSKRTIEDRVAQVREARAKSAPPAKQADARQLTIRSRAEGEHVVSF